MKKKIPALLLLFLLLLFSACGGKSDLPDTAGLPEGFAELPDLSGSYTDRQGTADVYSELDLLRRNDGTYQVSLSLFRLTTLECTAAYRDGILHFTCDSPDLEGDITVSGGAAEVTITASEFPGIQAEDVYRFPDGAAGSGGESGPAPIEAEEPDMKDGGLLSEDGALRIAQDYWDIRPGDVDEMTGNEISILYQGLQTWEERDYHSFALIWWVGEGEEVHASTLDSVYIDAQTGECRELLS